MLRSERRCAMRKTAVMSSNAAIGASKGLLSTCLRRNKHHQWPAIDAAQTMLAGRQQHQQQQQLPAGQQFLKLHVTVEQHLQHVHKQAAQHQPLGQQQHKLYIQHALPWQQQQQHHHQQQHSSCQQASPVQQQHSQQQHRQEYRTQSVPEWHGLSSWRQSPINNCRGWGSNNKPSAAVPATGAEAADLVPLANSLVGVALQVLHTADPGLKAALTHRGWRAYSEGHIPLQQPDQAFASRNIASSIHSSASSSDSINSSLQSTSDTTSSSRVHPPDRPARPPKPELVIPKQVPSPKDSPLPLNAHMLHNLAHIELNAIDLAWDTVARFSHLRLPPGFYKDFARVADDESRHFGWCIQRLAELGFEYGDMVAHDLLWEGAQGSAGDLGARLAIVPMSQEARGLDAGKRLVERLVGAGDQRSASIVAVIATEEKAHVALGVVWFSRLCVAMGVDPPSSFRAWLAALGPELLKGPFNHEARAEVGLRRAWYDFSAWPQELQQQLVKPAVAAQGKGLRAALPQATVQTASITSNAGGAGAAAGAAHSACSNIDRQHQHQQHGSSTFAGQNGPPAGQYAAVSTGVSQCHTQDMCTAAGLLTVVPQHGPLLEDLRQRLWQMLDIEASLCDQSVHT